MRIHHLHSLAVKVLRAASAWSSRHYRRELLREALWRIGREVAADRKRRGAGRHAHSRSVTPVRLSRRRGLS